jgi:tetratricopeptide (TPR) repeat protein
MTSSRKRLLALVFLLISGVGVWLGVEWWAARQPTHVEFGNEVARITGDLPETNAAPVRREGPVRLAIGPLGTGSPRSDGEAADLLTATLAAESGLQLVERRELVRLMTEIELGAAGAVKPAVALRLGKLVQADWFLLGGTYRGSAATNAVIRLVEAATGILRNLSVIAIQPERPDAFANASAALVRRELGATNAAARIPEYVAIGGFADVSLSPRFGELERNVRTHLAGALAGTPFVQLERELTTLLLEEVRMQQAGLVETGAALPKLQSAFWLVDGFWQALDSVGDEVELNLRVSRVGGAVQRRNLRAKLGSPLESAAATAMLELIRNAPPADQPATRKGEIRAQLAKGMERAGFTDESLESWSWGNWWNNRWNRDEQDMATRREHMQAAMQSFETVLLLDPGHGMAKLFLARCLVDPAVGKPGEARGLYRELLDSRNGLVARTAMNSLGESFAAYGDFDQAIATFRELESRAPESLKPGLRQRLEFASGRTRDQSREQVDWAAREAAALKAMAAWREQAKRFGHYGDSPVIGDFLAGPKKQAAERLARLESFLPQLLTSAPELEPHLLALVLRQWPATNHPFLAKFEASLKSVRQNPTNLLAPGNYFSRVSWDALGWAFDHKLDDLSGQMADTVLAARNAGVKFDFEPEFQMKVVLAYSYGNRPREAIAATRLMEHEVVQMSGSGPWGRHPSWLLRDAYRRQDQKKLGEPMDPEPNAFKLDQPVNIPALPFLFVPDGEQLWLVNANRVWNVPVAGGNSVTNLIGPESWMEPSSLQQTANALWIGTDLGLIRFDKRTHDVRRWTKADGLLLDEVRNLLLDGRQLWIGFGRHRQSDRRQIGGVSLLSLPDLSIRSFVPPLGEIRAQADDDEPDWLRAPDRPVKSFARVGDDQLAAAVDGVGVQVFDVRSETWNASVPKVTDREVELLAASPEWLIAGEAPPHFELARQQVLTISSRKTGEVHRVGTREGLPFPSVTALALDGDRLWVGGPCYLLILDLPTRSVVRRCMMNNTTVHQLQIADDTVWVRLNRAIYHFPRALAK